MIPNEVEILKEVRERDYPTPYFFTSKEILRHNYGMFRHLFDKPEVCYALKANSDPKVLTYLNEIGCGFEAASAYEIDLLLQLGVEPTNIIYGTSVKPADHIDKAFKNGVDRFAADSKEELDKLVTYAPGSRVFVRSIVDDQGSVFTMSERFGTPADTVVDLMMYAHKKGLKPYGISFYVGSQATVPERWANALRTVQPAIEELYKKGIKLEVINIGGGFPVAYDNHKDAPHLADIVHKLHNVLHELPYMPHILMEPGRGIVASSTVLVATVVSRTMRSGRVWLCLDAGIYNALYEAMIHQGATKYMVRPFVEPKNEPKSMLCTIAGPTGDSLDIITRDAVLPANIAVGDKLIFENAGAYTLSMASPFNGFPTPELYIH
jgi:ornithine decarboxylase